MEKEKDILRKLIIECLKEIDDAETLDFIYHFLTS